LIRSPRADKSGLVKTSKVSLLVIGAVALLTFRVSAVEYVTLRNSTQTVELNPKDIVEIVGVPSYFYTGSTPTVLDTVTIGLQFEGDTAAAEYRTARGQIYTSLLAVSAGNGFPVTLKITRAHEINAVQPTSVLVIPENATGNYDIVVETSDDTSTWTPFHSQTVSAADAKRFFRTRIVKRD
jgi:hypothetical protein